MKTVLFIDDDPDFLIVHGEALSRAGYHVIAKLDAESALSVLREDPKVDLVITEYQIPGLLFVSFMSMLRMRKVPVIVITGYCNMNVYLKCMGLGAFEYMSKPVRAEELTRVVKAALLVSESDGLSRICRY
jgi:DNA-binding NtrC family response regulator